MLTFFTRSARNNLTSGDQKRTLTPGEAIRAGVDHMVIGRPIIRAADPRGAASAIMDEIASVA